MLMGDFLKTKPISVSTGATQTIEANPPKRNESGESFADILAKNKVGFSGHALRRIESRSIDITENSKLDRLNKGVELAAQKGSCDALVLVDSTAFVVSVTNNKVITTMSGADLAETVFTNIDSTIIM